MVARAEGMLATRERIVRAALEAGARASGPGHHARGDRPGGRVSHQTVLNHFESKEKVAAAAAEMLGPSNPGGARPGQAGRSRRRDLASLPVNTRDSATPMPDGQSRLSGSDCWRLCSTGHAPAIRHGSSGSLLSTCRVRRPRAAVPFTPCTRPLTCIRGSCFVETCGFHAPTPNGSCSIWSGHLGGGNWPRRPGHLEGIR